MGDDNSASALSQEEIDRLMNGGSEADETTGTEKTDLSEPSAPVGETVSGALSQEALDDLFNENAQTGPEAEPEPAESEEAAQVDGVTFSQDDLDKLLSENAQTEPEAEAEPADSSEAAQEDGVTFSQDDLDKLLSENAQTEPETETEPADSGEATQEDGVTFSQDDLDKLLTENVQTEGPEAPVETELAAGADAGDGVLSQEDLDKLISETVDVENTDVPEPRLSDGDGETADGALSQNDLDKLISESIENEAVETLEEAPPEPVQREAAAGEDQDQAGLLSDEDLAYYQAFKESKSSSRTPDRTDTAEDLSDGSEEAPAPQTDGEKPAPEAVREDEEAVTEPEPDPENEIEEEDEPAPAAPEANDAMEAEDPEIAAPPDPEQLPEEGTDISESLSEEDVDFDLVIDTFEEVIERKPSPLKKILSVSAAAIVISAAAGWYFTTGRISESRNPIDPGIKKDVTQAVHLEPSASIPAPASGHDIQGSGAVTNTLLPPFLESVREADRIRHLLSAKQQKIIELKSYYQKGIDAAEEAVRQMVADGGNGVMAGILQDKEMVLTLQTIQRRKAYIAHLEEINVELETAGEELLFLKRQAVITSMLSPEAKNLDIESQAIHIHSMAQTHAVGIGNIVFEPSSDEPEPLHLILEKIVTDTEKPNWQEHEQKNKRLPFVKPVPVKTAETSSPVSKSCQKEADQRHLLSDLTKRTAECLSAWKGKDMILNKVSSLTPSAASQLAQWEGRWLALNALDSISPETAKQLFSWEGDRLSLNGLKKISPEISRYIPSWKGKHLEVTGLDELPFEVATDLAAWQKSGGTVWLPERLKGKQ